MACEVPEDQVKSARVRKSCPHRPIRGLTQWRSPHIGHKLGALAASVRWGKGRILADSSDSQKFAAGLGIVVSLITVLAFFGINNWDDLTKAMDHDRAETAEACTLADNALAYTSSSRGAAMLWDASNATDDNELRTRLLEAADALTAFHLVWDVRSLEMDTSGARQASAATETRLATAGGKADRTQKRLISYCEQ